MHNVVCVSFCIRYFICRLKKSNEAESSEMKFSSEQLLGELLWLNWNMIEKSTIICTNYLFLYSIILRTCNYNVITINMYSSKYVFMYSISNEGLNYKMAQLLRLSSNIANFSNETAKHHQYSFIIIQCIFWWKMFVLNFNFFRS